MSTLHGSFLYIKTLDNLMLPTYNRKQKKTICVMQNANNKVIYTRDPDHRTGKCSNENGNRNSASSSNDEPRLQF